MTYCLVKKNHSIVPATRKKINFVLTETRTTVKLTKSYLGVPE